MTKKMATQNSTLKEQSTTVEAEMNMTQELADTIHDSYVKAASKGSINAVEVEETLYSYLDDVETNEADQTILDYFLDKLSKSILARKQTFQATNMVTEILHVCIYIVAWLNVVYNAEIDTNITARRKALESELAKMLNLADELDPTQIMDRFGIRFILDFGINKSCFLLTKIVNVLCNLNRQDRKDFLKYIDKFDDATKYRINKVLEIPFILAPLIRKDDPSEFDPEKFKDKKIELPTDEERKMIEHLLGSIKFYFDPKKNGYQSIHVILMVDPTSPHLPGFQIEIQIRTWQMHMHAENDINASHDVHKDKVNLYSRIFTLSEEEQKSVCIGFFESYKDNQNDVDGIHFPKEFYNRRMNNISL